MRARPTCSYPSCKHARSIMSSVEQTHGGSALPIRRWDVVFKQLHPLPPRSSIAVRSQFHQPSRCLFVDTDVRRGIRPINAKQSFGHVVVGFLLSQLCCQSLRHGSDIGVGFDMSSFGVVLICFGSLRDTLRRVTGRGGEHLAFPFAHVLSSARTPTRLDVAEFTTLMATRQSSLAWTSTVDEIV